MQKSFTENAQWSCKSWQLVSHFLFVTYHLVAELLAESSWKQLHGVVSVVH